MPYGDVLTREEAWLKATGDGLPSLLATNGGHFSVIEAYVRRKNQAPHQVMLHRERTREQRIANGRKTQTHTVVAVVLWDQISSTARADLDQQGLDTALDDLLDRVRGLPQDHTHGNRFWQAGEGELAVEYPDARAVLNQDASPSPLGKAYTALVRYTLVEEIAG